MPMNRVETPLVNSPPRRWLQRWYETPTLLRFGGHLPPGGRAVEIGCGSGYGLQLLLTRFGADRVDGVDLDPAVVARARHRLAGSGDRARVAEGSATDLRAALGAADDAYDAVVDFAINHHIPDWRAAVAEVARVLAPGDRFYFDEVTRHALDRPSYRRLFDHPVTTGSPPNSSLPRPPATAWSRSARSPGSAATICSASPPNQCPDRPHREA